jgi:hypothetical protein
MFVFHLFYVVRMFIKIKAVMPMTKSNIDIHTCLSKLVNFVWFSRIAIVSSIFFILSYSSSVPSLRILLVVHNVYPYTTLSSSHVCVVWFRDWTISYCSYRIVNFHLFTGKNGVYDNLVKEVREAFEACDLVRVDCSGLNKSDCRKIGAKLKV